MAIDFQETTNGAAPNAASTPATAPVDFKQTGPNPPGSGVGGFLGNVGSDVMNAGGAFFHAIAHPIDTLKGLGNLALGAVMPQKALAPTSEENATQMAATTSAPQKAAAGLDSYISQNYGSINAFRTSLYERPVQTMLDISAALGGASGIAGKAGEAAKFADADQLAGVLNKASDVLKTGSKITNPMEVVPKATELAATGISKVASGAGRAVGEGLGISTGAGYGAIKEAFQNPDVAFTKALRGELTGEDVAKAAQDSLSAVKQARRDEYTAQLGQLKQAGQQLDISPITNEVKGQLDKFNISPGKDGALDFSRSAIRFDKEAQRTIQTIYDEMKGFGSKTGDRTVAGVDLLKQGLQSLYSDSSPVRAFTQAVAGKTRDVLGQVEGYNDLAKNYQAKTSFIDDVTKGLGMKEKGGQLTNVDNAIKKLTSIFRENNEFRKELVGQLQEAGGKDLKGMIAGYQLSPLAPRGLFGKLEEIGGGAAALHNPALLMHPSFIAGAAMASPRIVGEMLRGLGLSVQQSSNLLDAMASTKYGQMGAEIGAKIAANKPEILKYVEEAGNITSPPEGESPQ